MRGHEEILRVQAGIAVKPERTAMNFIRPGLYRSYNQRPAGAAELRGCHAGLHLEFIDRIRWREENNRINKCFVVINPIENKVIGLRTKSIHRQRSSALLSESKCFRVVVDSCGGIGTRGNPAAYSRYEC